MPRSDDWTPLLAGAAKKRETVGYRQGVITSWDPASGSNTVLIGGTEFSDLQVLSPNGSVFLIVGDNVLVLRCRGSYFIAGRVASTNNQRANLWAAGQMGPADVAFNSWPSTTATTDTELVVGILQRSTPNLYMAVRTYVGPNTSAVFRFVLNGHEVANSGVYTGGASGAIGDFLEPMAKWPSDTDFNTGYFGSCTARITAGTGKAACSVRGMYML